MELELGLALPNHMLDLNCGYNNRDDGEEVESKSPSLLLWNGHDNNNGDEEIEGWPPINALRKEFLNHHHRRPTIRRRSMYVKVKMQGVPIGRKIDLNLFDSYQALTDALVDMFAKYIKERHEDYTTLYQDKEGDWLLAGDAPWESFVESAQRIEIVRRRN